MTWRLGSLTREAVANLAANRLRTLALVVVVASCLGSLAFLEVRQASDLLAFEASYRTAGGYVAVVRENGGISAATCNSLNGSTGVIAAGAVSMTGQATFASAPGVLFQSAQVTWPAVRVWAPGTRFVPPATPYVLAGPALASELGVRAGLFLQPRGDPPALLAAVLDSGARDPQTGRWLIEVVPPTGSAQECWVEFTPQTFEAGVSSVAARFTTGDHVPTVQRYTQRDQFSRSPAQELASRPQRFGWIAVAGLVAALFGLVAWFRRADLGLYLALGTTRSQLTLMLAVECGCLVAAGWLVGDAWAFAIHRLADGGLTGGSLRMALTTSGSAALAAFVAAPLLGSGLVRGSIASLLKDR